MKTVPFTYLIGWSTEKRYYYGVRYKRGTTPVDLWTIYFTSSKFVKRMRELHGEPDIIEIRKIFQNIEAAINWESRVLKRMKVSQRSDFINIHDSKAMTCFGRVASTETRMKMAEAARRRRGEKRSIAARENMRKAQQNHHKYSVDARKKMSEAAKKRTRLPWSEETKAKMSESARKVWERRRLTGSNTETP